MAQISTHFVLLSSSSLAILVISPCPFHRPCHFLPSIKCFMMLLKVFMGIFPFLQETATTKYAEKYHTGLENSILYYSSNQCGLPEWEIFASSIEPLIGLGDITGNVEPLLKYSINNSFYLCAVFLDQLCTFCTRSCSFGCLIGWEVIRRMESGDTALSR